MKIAMHGDTILDVPTDSWYSFYNSPYVGHRAGTAVDVYFSSSPLMPVEEGKVIEIRRVRPPQHVKGEIDFVIVMEVGGICLKILHVAPSIKVGERLVLGDEIGTQIISGFFMPWSTKHAHFELRPCNDRIRARGAYPLIPVLYDNVPATCNSEFEVVQKEEHFYWLKPARTNEMAMTPLLSGSLAVEGGIPHYGLVAAFGDVSELRLFGARTHRTDFKSGVSIFPAKFSVLADGQRVRGIGIYCNQPRIKLLGGEFEVGDVVKIEAMRPHISAPQTL